MTAQAGGTSLDDLMASAKRFVEVAMAFADGSGAGPDAALFVMLGGDVSKIVMPTGVLSPEEAFGHLLMMGSQGLISRDTPCFAVVATGLRDMTTSIDGVACDCMMMYADDEVALTCASAVTTHGRQWEMLHERSSSQAVGGCVSMMN